MTVTAKAVTGEQAREAMKHRRVYAMLRLTGLEPMDALCIVVEARRGTLNALLVVKAAFQLRRMESRK